MKKTLKATIAALLGYSIYGFSFIFTKIALGVALPDVLLSYRFILAFLVLNLMLLTGKVSLRLKGKSVGKLLLMGFIQPVIYFIFESYGIEKTSASLSGVTIGLVPVAGLIFGVLFLKEKCGIFQLVCTVMSVIGVALTTSSGTGEFSITGFMMLLVAVGSTTTFSVLSRSISDEFSPYERTYVMTALGSVCFTLIALIKTKGDISLWKAPLESGEFIFSTFYLAVISSVCAFTLINFALNHLDVGHTLIFSNFTSVISVLSGVFVLKDSFTPMQIAGIVLIITGVFGVSYYNTKKPSKDN